MSTGTLLQKVLRDRELAALYAEEDLLFRVTEAIAEAMEQKGWSQAQLAEELGISRQAVSAMLQGRNVSVRKVAQVLHALGFRLEIMLQSLENQAGTEWKEKLTGREREPQTVWRNVGVSSGMPTEWAA